MSWPRRRNSAHRCGAGGSNEIRVPRASSRMALGSAAMVAADTGIKLATWINAGLSLVVAFTIATLLDRAFRARAVREAAGRAGLSREGATRPRFLRRLVYATIVVIGVAIALSGFTGINNLARSLLASGAIAAAIIGFAA